MARDATARLYDVDDQSLAFTRLNKTKEYDQAAITFRAKKDRLIDLEQLHESIWATRLSGGTGSGVVCLKVTTVGQVTTNGDETVLKVSGSNGQFVFVDDVSAKPKDAEPSVLAELRQAVAAGHREVRVTGYVDGWSGRWPSVLGKPPSQKPSLMVIGFDTGNDE